MRKSNLNTGVFLLTLGSVLLLFVFNHMLTKPFLGTLLLVTASLLVVGGAYCIKTHYQTRLDRIFCPVCHSCKVDSFVAVEDSLPMEEEYRCPQCGIVGYWAYGFFDPSFPYPTDSHRREIEKNQVFFDGENK